MEFEIFEPWSNVKIYFEEGKTPFGFYYITENVVEVTSAAMRLRIMEFYTLFIYAEVGLKFYGGVKIISKYHVLYLDGKEFILK